ncbi:DNA modification methylase [Peptoniphilus senegalensis]|uniref:DNA modification methylase n=1 Tax=Peptoniphilus senegalensis TaxID=1465757 RepID=UPI0002FB1A92|nr:DNA modification methylase [Peptoniphilus senegalensis]
MKKIKRDQVIKNIDEIIPYINNPRDNEPAVDAVASSIKNFGFNQPIAIDSKNEIIAGHTRYKAAKKLDLKEIPCVIIDDLTDEEVRAYRLADNKVAEKATWNKELLAEELAGLGNLDMTLFGFDESDFKDDFQEDDFNIEEELGKIDEPTSKLGDIFELGDHILMCGDSTKLEDINKIARSGEIDLVITDPPYNVEYEGKKKKREKIKNDSMQEDEFSKFLKEVFANIKELLKPGGAFYVWHADRNRFIFSKSLRDAGLEERQNLIWIKNNITIGRSDYQWKHEPCLYGWKEGAAHYFIADFTNTSVYDDVPNLARMNKNELKEYAKKLLEIIEDGTTIMREDKPLTSPLHPTMKPITLIAKQIKNSSKDGEIVLDLFGGSGTTLIAAEQTGRKSRIIELDPIYVDVIIARWEKFTGQKARKIN